MLMGSETEFGILDGWSLDAAASIQRRIEACHPHLPSTHRGVFLRNGSRVYVDQEAQNEYDTPEVEDPLLLVRHELAGRVLMREAAAAEGRVLLCSNLDYASRHSWGTHENYECRAAFAPRALDLLLTHLATRIVFSGAGGPHPDQPGMQLVISPRATVTGLAYAAQGTLSKAMVFGKPDQYGAGHRLHVFCGESLLCPRASWLKYGTTALVAHCLDAGLLQTERLVVRDPLLTLHNLNDDLEFEARFPLRDGALLTGLQIQRRIVDGVADHRAVLPSWADGILSAWYQILDLLAARDPRVCGMVDWLLYRRLWHTLAREHGFRPDELLRLQDDITLGILGEPVGRHERYRQISYHPHSGWFDEGPSKGPPHPPCIPGPIVSTGSASFSDLLRRGRCPVSPERRSARAAGARIRSIRVHAVTAEPARVTPPEAAAYPSSYPPLHASSTFVCMRSTTVHRSPPPPRRAGWSHRSPVWTRPPCCNRRRWHPKGERGTEPG